MYQSRGVLAQVHNQRFFFARLQKQGQDARSVQVGSAMFFRLRRIALHESEAADFFHSYVVLLQEARGSFFFLDSGFHGLGIMRVQRLFLQFGIADAGVIHRLQLFFEYGFHGGDVLEGDGAFLEVAIFYLRIDDFLYQIADAFFGIFGQAA